eukprot:264500-Rhodomonas_salina.1
MVLPVSYAKCGTELAYGATSGHASQASGMRFLAFDFGLYAMSGTDIALPTLSPLLTYASSVLPSPTPCPSLRDVRYWHGFAYAMSGTEIRGSGGAAVSYTHLTLPTICSV